jgi:hypothetical protein
MPLVEHEVETDSLPFEIPGHTGCTLQAADFLVVAKRKIEGATGSETFCEQRFQRLHQRDHADLVIDTATTPDNTVPHHSTERRMCPLAQGVLLDRHHIEVAHEQHRFQLSI